MSVNSFQIFCEKYFHPIKEYDENCKKNDQTKALAILFFQLASYIFFPIPLGVGIAYGVYTLKGRVQKGSGDFSVGETQNIAQSALKRSSTLSEPSASPLTTDSIPLSSSESSRSSYIEEETSHEQLLRISRNVITNENALWSQANGDISNFLDLIRAEFSKENRSLSHALSEQEIFRQLCSIERVAAAIKLYKFMDLSLSVFLKKDEFTKKAMKFALENDIEFVNALTLLISRHYRNNGYSLSEVLKNKTLVDIFAKSSRLTAVLKTYVQLKEGPQFNDSPEASTPPKSTASGYIVSVRDDLLKSIEMNESKRKPPTDSANNIDDNTRETALRLAREDFDEAGSELVTRLGLSAHQSDEKKLAREVKKYFQKNHSDKTKEQKTDEDKNKYKLFSNLHNLIKTKTYNIYRKEFEKNKKMFELTENIKNYEQSNIKVFTYHFAIDYNKNNFDYFDVFRNKKCLEIIVKDKNLKFALISCLLKKKIAFNELSDVCDFVENWINCVDYLVKNNMDYTLSEINFKNKESYLNTINKKNNLPHPVLESLNRIVEFENFEQFDTTIKALDLLASILKLIRDYSGSLICNTNEAV